MVETTEQIFMVETKGRIEMEAAEVLAKKEAALKWCGHATVHAKGNGGKPWQYLMVPHDVVAENMTLAGLGVYWIGICYKRAGYFPGFYDE